MKKFVFCFVCYIGCLLINFNLAGAADKSFQKETQYPLVNITLPAPITDSTATESTLDDVVVSKELEMHLHDNAASEQADTSISSKQSLPLKKKRVRVLNKITAELYKLALIPFVIDRLYPDTEIKKDITGTLAQFYPTVNQEKLALLGKYVRYFVSAKRRYEYVVKRLEQQIKAMSIIPEDAPIIAEVGEYATAYPDDRKQTSSDEYQVKYNPYKYLEYDKGEYGEPVRRRDKNYQEKIRNVDEIILALLKFDIRGFVKALQKIPAASDGSNEKPTKLDNGLQARLLLALSSPGDNEKIRGVIDVLVPKEHYINGDFLNSAVRPRFFLSEDKDDELNIKEYQLFLPEANSVVKDGEAKRILTNIVRYPIEFTRQDITKPMKIKGNFSFMLCDKDGACVPTQTEHELTLHPSENEELSLYYNYVTQGFTHLPAETAPHAQLNSAVYDTSNHTMTLNFKTSRVFSQVAVMVEDAVGTNFINPQYLISEDNVTVSFEASPPVLKSGNGADGNEGISSAFSASQEIAVTAMFDDMENLRKIISPSIISSDEGSFSSISITSAPKVTWWETFIFGMFLNFMPAIFYLFVKLINLFWMREDRIKIFIRYAFGLAVGLGMFGLFFHQHYWGIMYETAMLTALSAVIAVSFLCECLGIVDFSLFRPFRGKIRRGFLSGLFTIILLTSFPMFLAPKILSNILIFPPFQFAKHLFAIWLGILILPLITLFFPRYRPLFLPAMQRLNIVYNIIYLLGIFWLISFLRGETCFLLVLVCLALVFGFWYIYLATIEKVILPIRGKTKQRQAFYQIQRNMFVVLLFLFLLTYGVIALFPIKTVDESAPTPIDIMQRVKETDTPVLVNINAPWGISFISNNFFEKKLSQENIQVINIEVSGEALAAQPWFAYYNQRYTPLNILFNNRHPKGMKLPSTFKKINWERALELFEDAQPNNERTLQND